MTKIKVALRVRPLSQREIIETYPIVVAVENNSAFITDIRVPERPSADSRPRYRQFDFDHTFWFSPNGENQLQSQTAASQQEVYNEMGPYLEKAILRGYNACLLAYGQSGSGKTHTMIGSKTDPGIIPRLCQSLLDKLRLAHPPQSNGQPNFRMEVSFLEIYREKVRDLLNPESTLKLREHPQLGPHVQGLTRLEVTGEISLLDLLWEGEGRRAMGNTSSNRRSSRSHAIWTLYLTVFTESNQQDSETISKSYRLKQSPANDDERKIITNQVHLVDLAGSEKADCTTAKSLLAEGADINRSLVALGNVISALAERAQYVPYRDSALTWLLKDSIGGNASTSIIITASPSSHCHAQTLNSLRFAQRARLVENTLKINLAPSNQYGPYGFLSVMSAMELKKDISRLAKLIKTAQNNGGILRGLAPRAGWTRLIHAIEGINQAEKEQVRLQRERACSEDTTASSSQAQSITSINSSSSSATLTATKSLNDVMVQANIDKPLNNLRRRQSRQNSESALATIASSSKTSTKVRGTEVFIPTSNSYKCLTWQQEETRPVPKPLSESTTSITSSDDEDHASRISEKIHGNIVDENYQNKTEVIPVEVKPSPLEITPLIMEQIPTLVNPRDLPEMPLEEVKNQLSNEKPTPPTPVCQMAKEEKEYLFPMKCKQFATATTLPTIPIVPFESSDEYEFDEPEETPSAPGIYRAVHPSTSKSLERTLDSEPNCTFDETAYYTGVQSTLSQISAMVISSSSSYESINMPDTVRPVNLVRDFSETNDITEDSAETFTIDNEVFKEDYEPPVASVLMVPGQSMDTAMPSEILVAEAIPNVPTFNPINGVSDCKFRNYFAKELHQMDMMGKQIKTLLQRTQRYNILKPYLDEISNLQNADHSKPDPVLDPHIDSCSGWNVDIELAKVDQEIKQLHKVLKTGLGSDGMANIEVKISSTSLVPRKSHLSSTSTIQDGLTSDDSSFETDYFTSFAHTRQIPLLSKSNHKKDPRLQYKSSTSTSTSNQSAKNSVSQPILSSSSSTSNNNPTPSSHLVHLFRQNVYSTPKRGKPSSFYPHEGEPINHLPPTGMKSVEVFYRNPDVTGEGPSSLQNYLSNSNMSSSNVGIGLDTNFKPSSHRLQLSASLSEPRTFSGHSRSLVRTSESSTNFQSNYNHHQRHPSLMTNAFNPDEIRSHRHLYENRLSDEPLDKAQAKIDWNFQNGIPESPEYNYYPYYQRPARSSTLDSLDLCSCGDDKCSAGLEKSSSRSQFSSFGGSTTTDTSEYFRNVPQDYLYSHIHQNNHNNHSHTHSKCSSDAESHSRSYFRKPDNYENSHQHPKNLYKHQQINRNENF